MLRCVTSWKSRKTSETHTLTRYVRYQYAAVVPIRKIGHAHEPAPTAEQRIPPRPQKGAGYIPQNSYAYHMPVPGIRAADSQ